LVLVVAALIGVVIYLVRQTPIKDEAIIEGPGLETKELVDAYIRENIGTLSPEPAVLGGSYYVTELSYLDADTALVLYEDGHVVHTAEMDFSVSDEGVVTINNVWLLDDVPEPGTTRFAESEARSAAQSAPACLEVGTISAFEGYSEDSKTWWFTIEAPKTACAPACVVDDETMQINVNWRCTGFVER